MKNKHNPSPISTPSPSETPPNPILCVHCKSDDLIVDTGVCSIPKGKDRDKDLLRYQTLCTRCGAVSSVELTEAQLLEIIKKEDMLVERLLVSGGV